MRRWKRCAAAVAVAVFISSGALMGGCGKQQQKASAPPPAEYGVVDLETLVTSHPRYSEYYKLKTEYDHLLQQYKNEQKELIRASSLQEAKIRQAAGQASMDQVLEKEYQAKLKMKEDELNRGLKAFYEKIEGQHIQSGNATSSSNLDQGKTIRIANLQMKLAILKVEGHEKEKAESELKELLNRRQTLTNGAPDGWTEAEKQQLAEQKEAAQKEMAAYADSLGKTLASERIKRMDQAALAAKQSMNLPQPEIWNGEWQQKMDAKKNEVARVKEAIMKDIRDKSAVIAQEKNLVMIFSSYRANISALDVTGDVVSEIIRIQPQEVNT